MLPRVQRIVSGIELFALVFWVGGLFFVVAFVEPVLGRVLNENPDAAWEGAQALRERFGPLELIFAVSVLVSNFLKVAVFRAVSLIQRAALMVAAMTVIFTCAGMFMIRPQLQEKRAALTTLAAEPGRDQTPERREFEELRQQQDVLLAVNWGLGLFLVYAYRSFEERKLQALARIIKMP